jgi:hypothetical protein
MPHLKPKATVMPIQYVPHPTQSRRTGKVRIEAPFLTAPHPHPAPSLWPIGFGPGSLADAKFSLCGGFRKGQDLHRSRIQPRESAADVTGAGHSAASGGEG